MISNRGLRIASFIGWSDSGKTTLIVALIEECHRRGVPCAAAKFTRHTGDLEPEGKDSARYRQAGASPVAFVGTGPQGLTAVFSPTPQVPDRAWLESLFPNSELVLVEGFEPEDSIRVLVYKAGEEPKRPLASMDIIVSDNAGLRDRVAGAGKRACAPSDLGGLLGMMEELWLQRKTTGK